MLCQQIAICSGGGGGGGACPHGSLQKKMRGKKVFMGNSVENREQRVLFQVPRTKLRHNVDEWPFCPL